MYFLVSLSSLLSQFISSRRGVYRRIYCAKLSGRCETECLSFQVKIGGCRADLTPFCYKQRYFKS
uniref:Beta-defensin n=1 Tax=Castor canadensis TaxID=51338 RepID=A0A8C0WKX5_CASCN